LTKVQLFRRNNSSTVHYTDMPDVDGSNSDHDLRYYTETEIDSKLNDLDTAKYDSTVVDAFITDLDTAKYDSTTVDTLLDDKVALADSALHQHVEADITDLDKYTTTEVDLLLDDKANQADTTNWNTAYGWGDHADQNYFDTDLHTLDDIPDGSTYKLSHNDFSDAYKA